MAIAVSIRWAMTQPTIFSRDEIVEGKRKRYAFESRRTSGVRGGDDSVKFIVSRRDVSCESDVSGGSTMEEGGNTPSVQFFRPRQLGNRQFAPYGHL